MIRHMFFGKVKDGVPDAEIDRLVDAWNAMGSKIDTIRSIRAGRNACATDRQYTVALVADFDDWDGWKTYAEHPEHDAIRREISSKIIDPDRRGTIQLEL
jgi:hypothetical protein